MGVKTNRCKRCKILDVTTCPLRDHAWQLFKWDGLESCAMGDAIDKMLIEVKVGWKSLNGKEKI